MSLGKMQENLMQKIANTLTYHVLKMELPKMIKQVEEDPTLQASLLAMKYHAAEAKRQLENMCKQYPNSKPCKEHNQVKK